MGCKESVFEAVSCGASSTFKVATAWDCKILDAKNLDFFDFSVLDTSWDGEDEDATAECSLDWESRLDKTGGLFLIKRENRLLIFFGQKNKTTAPFSSNVLNVSQRLCKRLKLGS